MRAIGIVLIQVVIAVLVSGLVMPAVLFSVPQTRVAGPLVLVILVALLFGLLRLAWPQPSGKVHSEGDPRE
jgi:apolipoprotein N-acyltransferase